MKKIVIIYFQCIFCFFSLYSQSVEIKIDTVGNSINMNATFDAFSKFSTGTEDATLIINSDTVYYNIGCTQYEIKQTEEEITFKFFTWLNFLDDDCVCVNDDGNKCKPTKEVAPFIFTYTYKDSILGTYCENQKGIDKETFYLNENKSVIESGNINEILVKYPYNLDDVFLYEYRLYGRNKTLDNLNKYINQIDRSKFTPGHYNDIRFTIAAFHLLLTNINQELGEKQLKSFFKKYRELKNIWSVNNSTSYFSN